MKPGLFSGTYLGYEWTARTAKTWSGTHLCTIIAIPAEHPLWDREFFNIALRIKYDLDLWPAKDEEGCGAWSYGPGGDSVPRMQIVEDVHRSIRTLVQMELGEGT